MIACFLNVKKQNLKNKEDLMETSLERIAIAFCIYAFLHSVISIVETMRLLFSPSRGGISAVPMVILLTCKSLMNRFRAISATSTAVVIAWPRAFNVISFVLPEERLVMIAST
jgi:hypothetical protein